LIDQSSKERGRAYAPSWWWQRAGGGPGGTDPTLAIFRRFCRLRGIELPYRTIATHGARSNGLAVAIERAVEAGRCDSLIVLTDGIGVGEQPERVARALTKAKRRCRQLTALVADPSRFIAPAKTVRGGDVRAVAVADARAMARDGLALLARHGVQLVHAGPDDLPSALLARRGRGAGPARAQAPRGRVRLGA
jgi:hypothetical protein